MYLNQYMIEGTINLDSHGCFGSVDTYPNFQEELDKFKNHLIDLVDNKESKTFNGDIEFLDISSHIWSSYFSDTLFLDFSNSGNSDCSDSSSFFRFVI